MGGAYTLAARSRLAGIFYHAPITCLVVRGPAGRRLNLSHFGAMCFHLIEAVRHGLTAPRIRETLLAAQERAIDREAQIDPGPFSFQVA